MAGTGPTDLHTLALEVLIAAAEALETIPVYDATLVGAPDRQFVTYGPPVLDCCDQLTVGVSSIGEGASAPVPPRLSVARINRVVLTITASRCVPMPDDNGNPPTTASQEAAAEQINADKWALWNHLYNMAREGLLFSQCCDVIWGALGTMPPSGGCGGSILSVTVCFDGYEETFGT